MIALVRTCHSRFPGLFIITSWKHRYLFSWVVAFVQLFVHEFFVVYCVIVVIVNQAIHDIGNLLQLAVRYTGSSPDSETPNIDVFGKRTFASGSITDVSMGYYV